MLLKRTEGPLPKTGFLECGVSAETDLKKSTVKVGARERVRRDLRLSATFDSAFLRQSLLRRSFERAARLTLRSLLEIHQRRRCTAKKCFSSEIPQFTLYL
ncbi:hypothetical protein ISCGN_021420 [Ixodes scapularis]